MVFHPAGHRAELADGAPGSDATAEAPAAGVRAVATGLTSVMVRSALSATASLRLRLGDTAIDLIEEHAVLPDGTVVLAVDAMTQAGGLLVAARGRPGAVRLDVTQLIPVAVRSRVRDRVWVLGTARRFDPASLDSCDDDTVLSLLDLPPVALWAVEPVEVGLIRDGDEMTVSVSAYRAALPDPLATVEAAHLQHLVQRHGDVLDQLATLVDPAVTARSTRVVPVAVDADGMVLRVEAADGHSDARLPFPIRATGHAGLAEGLRMLLAEASRPGSGRPPRTAAVAARPPATACDLPAAMCGIPSVTKHATPEQ
ncbi:DUF2470 domain-containing protein [Micromonospora sp. NBC_00858]|uniref:DUF2470 domain-containing protein n=1 Tax=Micromonospora sp. NBC_00858 TaxID=2975979 RepID=UPI00386F6EFE